MIQPAFIVDDTDDQVRNFLKFMMISFCCHIAVFVIVAFARFPSSFERHIKAPPAIAVDLLAFNPETPLPPAKVDKTVVPPKVSEPVAPRVEKPRPKPVNKIAKAPVVREPELLPVKAGLQKKKNPADYVVQKPKKVKKIIKPLMKKKIDTAEVIQDAVKRMEKETEAAHSKAVADRIASLEKEVAHQSGGAPGRTSKTASSNNSYPKDFSQIEIFQAEVSVRLKNNWVFSEKLAGETKGLESRLVIKVLPDGTITDVWFEKRSGNEYLDNSAYKTVMKSNPLPPLPPGFPYYHLVLGFTPSGLHQ